MLHGDVRGHGGFVCVGCNEKDDMEVADKQLNLFILAVKFAFVVVFCVGPGCQVERFLPFKFPPIVLSRVVACWWPGLGWVQVALLWVGPTRKPWVQQ